MHAKFNGICNCFVTGREAEVIRQTVNDEPIAINIHKSIATFNNTQEEVVPKVNTSRTVFDPIAQGQVINKLASEIEELKTRIEEISVQNERLFNKTILEHSNLTAKVP